MRAVSVMNPWAWAIATGRKTVENRGRPQPWLNAEGETLALHASKGLDTDAWLGQHARMARAFADARRLDYPEATPGAILATFTLADVHPARDLCCTDPHAQPDQWHLVVEDLRPLTVPIPCRGALGLWTVPADVERGIAFQLTTLDEARDEPAEPDDQPDTMELFA